MSWQHVLLLQGAHVQFPAPVLNDSHSPVTPAPGNLMPSVGLHRHLGPYSHMHREKQTHTHNLNIKIKP